MPSKEGKVAPLVHPAPLAREIILEILSEVSPEHFDILREIVELEDTHLADKRSPTGPLIAAIIERAAKEERA
jgi:hypothetical protein